MNNREYILAELRRERAAKEAERRAKAQRNLAIAVAIVVGVALLTVCTVQLLTPTAEAETVPLYDIAIGEENTAVTTEAPELTSLGEFNITGYCPNCPDCCGKWASDPYTASGTVATVGRTVAVDTDIIPFGTVLIIDGKEYVAEDTGSGVKGKHIDIACATHDECYAITGKAEVWTR